MSRSLCVNCKFSLQTCLCEDLSVLENKLKVIILQHPSEVKITKNTARLLTLCLTQYDIMVGETQADFAQLNTLPVATTALLYPDDNAILLDDESTAAPQFKSRLSHLIVIDGTWKKAFKIMQLTPALAAFKKVSFTTIPQNRYRIRKAPRADSLSTLEAVAHSLALIEHINPEPLYQALEALNSKQTQFMPEHIKARYQAK
ncbi:MULTISPECIES: tRNA-uridine aminocarboxypropyltransferase [unclassified Pseudoalteromonas]|uniref:tRNA-uridine aminocarboxypropyltransferase n=1 Tax=unclassified Pseudoalteromonas TaxID=194690 RepID=UPI00160002C5|nr:MULTISPECIES: tRNA-uridine aminocarboxypropyltransferase [unclassified Pseudoalteromonas]MBB1416425.1 DTW domain-containing protein [Pseudoalteromonas sp. SG44-1]MBB1433143.1 DTW domain-containing protein [Pseudoalteromonas sp. SG43-6]MBB1479897.1 DTW domain-containing protein [Pseudoalteromonas sp. SG41-2]